MEAVWQFLQANWLPITATGGVLLLLRYSPCAGGACSLPAPRRAQRGTEQPTSASATLAGMSPGAARSTAVLQRPVSVEDLQTELAHLRAQRERLAEQIDTLQAGGTESEFAARPAMEPALK